MTILVCFGTRPEWIKIKPLINKLDCKLLFTGQHRDLVKDIDFDYTLYQNAKNHNRSNARLNAVVEDCLSQFPSWEKFDYVLVQGDTATAFGCALAAFNLGIKVIHLEAGLRTRDLDNPYPEEGYRQMISRIASVNLCPTELAKENLIREGIYGAHVVGNTVLDAVRQYKDQETYGNKVLVTLHRRENHELMANWFHEVETCAKMFPDLKFVLPLHPNPNVQKHKGLLQEVNVVDPMSHDDLIKTILESRFCITDSGGIQEEASFFNKKSIVCRKTTERSEGIDTGHVSLCKNPRDLIEMVTRFREDYTIEAPCPFGDGHSANRIKQLLGTIVK